MRGRGCGPRTTTKPPITASAKPMSREFLNSICIQDVHRGSKGVEGGRSAEGAEGAALILIVSGDVHRAMRSKEERRVWVCNENVEGAPIVLHSPGKGGVGVV